MPANELISSIVIARNERTNITQTIEAVRDLDDVGEHMRIVDDDSHDRPVSIVKEIASTSGKVRLVESGKKCGRGFVWDRGIAKARGEHIATLDADILLSPVWLVQARSAIEKHSVVGRTLVPDGDVAHIHCKFRLTPQFVGNTTVTRKSGLYRRKVFGLVRFDMASQQEEDVALIRAIKQAL